MAHQHPQPGHEWRAVGRGAVAQLGERRLCKAEVGGSSPPGSTTNDRATAHTSAGNAAAARAAGGVLGGSEALPGRHLHNGRAQRAQNKLRETQLEYDGEREPAGRRGPQGYVRVRWQFRSRECLTKGQATKGARRMPRRHGPMKDVARLRKAPASCLASSTGDLRMGQPGPLHRGSRPAEHIGRIEGTGGTETSQYPEEKKRFP